VSLQRLRDICLALPGAAEQESWGHPTFRVKAGGKMFAACPVDGRTVTFKADPDELPALRQHPRAFYPDYVGAKGWVGLHLSDDVDWDEVAELLQTSWALIAPKRAVAAWEASR
jgi:predicted DNA-binding protein (MmcQ/YjbR family)